MNAGLSRVVVCGGGLGAVRVVEELRSLGHTGPVTVLTDEPLLPYDRPPLTKQVLAGAVDVVPLWTAARREQLRADVLTGTAAAGLDSGRREVTDSGGRRHQYDHLVIATGARPLIPRIPGKERLHTVRGLRDAHRLRDALRPGATVVVVGGGVLGCEVAATAARRDCRVVLAEAGPVPMARAIGHELGGRLADLHRRAGVDLRCSASATGVSATSDGRHRVVLTDGTAPVADAVVAAIGIRPATAWLADSGLALDDGVLCDSRCRASLPGVHAVGDVCRWTHPITGVRRREEHWSAVGEQARIVAYSLLGLPEPPDMTGVLPYFWSDQYELKIQVLGRPGEVRQPPVVEELDRPGALLARFHDDGGHLVAAVGFSAGGPLMRLRTSLRRDNEGQPWLT